MSFLMLVSATTSLTFLQTANGVKFLARGGKDEPGTEKFLEYFYKNCIGTLFKPFADLPEAKNFTGTSPQEWNTVARVTNGACADSLLILTREKANLYLYLCDMLCSFAQQHSFRSHFYLLTSNVALRVATLLKAKDKHLRLGTFGFNCLALSQVFDIVDAAAFRLYRVFLKLKNRNLFNQLIKYDLLEPILDLTFEESRRDNLLSSSCHEFFEFMRKVRVVLRYHK